MPLFVEQLRTALIQQGYLFESPPTRATFFARKRLYGLWRFFPNTDFVFIHDFDRFAVATAGQLTELHEAARRYANAQYRWPKALRLHIPNIITIGVSSGEIPADCIASAQACEISAVGGEQHSIHLIEIEHQRYFVRPLQRVRGVAYGHNPTNRSIFLMQQLLQKLWMKPKVTPIFG